jgi:hypothetical protein
MDTKEKDYLITLDDNKEYALIDMMEFAGSNYVYLIELENYENTIFAELVDNKIRTIQDKELYAKVIEEFAKRKDL